MVSRLTSCFLFLPAIVLSLIIPIAVLAVSDSPPSEPVTRPASSTDVALTGALTTSLPIVIPQARGPIPRLGVHYNSLVGNGLVGVGWSLEGFPAVVRSRNDIGMNFTTSDTFSYLPGGWGTPESRDDRLKHVFKADGSNHFYRAKIRSGEPVGEFRQSTQTCGSGPCYWWMLDGSGTTYYFGGDASNHAGMYAPGAWHPVLWEPNNGATQHRGIVVYSLYKVVDPDGNYYRVWYNENDRTLWPQRVEYNLPEVGSQAGSMAVTFEYVNRPDTTPMPYYYQVRLNKIRVFGRWSITSATGTLVRIYQFDHTVSLESGSSLLTAFKEFGSDGDLTGAVSLEPITFTYSSRLALPHHVTGEYFYDGQGSHLFPSHLYVENCDPTQDTTGRCLWNSFVGDLDGDGRADLVRTYYGMYGGKVRYWCGQGANAKRNGSSTFPYPDGLVYKGAQSDYTDNQPPYLTSMADFNGDGRQDMVAIHPSGGTLTTYIAYGGANGSDCSLGGWIMQANQTVSGVPMSSDPSDWRLLPADLDNDGLADVVLFDKANNVLYYKMYRNGGLAATLAGRFRGGSEWTTCNANYPYPASLIFNGIKAADYNGDGKSDIIAMWTRSEIIGTLWSGQIALLAANGTSTGLTTPTETCTTPTTPYGTPAVRYPFMAMRQGDLNGDAIVDSLFTYQGYAIAGTNCAGLCNGVVHGRDIRFRFGTTSTTANNLRIYATDEFTYPYASATGRHLNQWEFAFADINGDGIDDYIQSYIGRYGNKLYYALGTPTGLQSLVGHLDSNAEYNDGSSFDYSFSTVTVGDFDGDGKKDVARGVFGGERPCGSSCIIVGGFGEIFRGTTVGLSATSSSFVVRDIRGGNSRALRMLAADFNGDGRDDILYINDNAERPPLGGLGPKNNGTFQVVFGSKPAVDNGISTSTGLPDLLTSINNGTGGTTTITYRLPRDFANAVRTDWSDRCYAYDNTTLGTGYIHAAAVCGQINGRPRPLVMSVSKSAGISRNGAMFVTRTSFDYTNARVYGGLPSQRADLGFSEIKRTNLDTGAYAIAIYRQDKPLERTLDNMITYNSAGTPIHQQSHIFYNGEPYSGVKSVIMSDEFFCEYEDGTKLPCFHRYYAYNPFYLVVGQMREGTNDIPGEHDIFTQHEYSFDDSNWLVRPLASYSYRRNTANTRIVRDMTRTTYDTAAGKTTHVLKKERLLFNDAETATCRVIDDGWNPNTCSEKIADGSAHWVTTFTTYSGNYDVNGNLLWFGSYPVWRDFPNPDWVHPVTLSYDETYRGLVRTEHNALNHTTTRGYDFAGRLTSITDPNNRTSSITYDVYGRTSTYAPPDVRLYQKRWTYGPYDSLRGYPVSEFTYSNVTTRHELRQYYDGFGGLAEMHDYSGIPSGEIASLQAKVFSGNQFITRSSLPYFVTDAASKYAQVTYDDKGRPLTVERVNTSFARDNTASGRAAVETFSYAASPDARHLITTYTDATGNSSRIYTDYRGNVVRVIDATGGELTYSFSIGFDIAGVTLPTNTSIAYTYDSWHRLTTENDPTGSGFVTYRYDDTSGIVRKIFYTSPAMTTKTRELAYYYDRLDRLTSEGEITNNGSAYTPKAQYTYDGVTTRQNGLGRLTSVSDTSGTTSFDYDGRGNIVTKSITVNGLSPTYTFNYTYNDRDLLIQKQFPDANQLYYYTSDGVLTDVLHNGAYWGQWQNWNAFKQPGHRLTYWDGSQWANITNYTYDIDQQLATLVINKKDGTNLQNLSYGYDAVGNVRRITDNRVKKTVNGISTDLTQTFAYDRLNRLCAVWSSVVSAPTCARTSLAPSATFAYDGIGNLTADSGSRTAYTTAGGQTTIENRTGSTVNWRAYHDSEGKRIRFEDCSYSPCINFYYGYDYKARLLTVTKDGIVNERYEYNYADERTKKSFLRSELVDTIHSWFIGGDYEVRQSTAKATRFAKTLSVGAVANYTYGDLLSGQATVAKVDSARGQPFVGNMYYGVPQGTYIRHNDHLGTPSLMTKWQDGSEATRYTFDVWGEQLTGRSLGRDTSNAKFTDQTAEQYSRLMYYGGRYYHPKTRRFITADDRIVPGGAQGYNRFAYVRNNPATYFDPFGHQDSGGVTKGGSISTCATCGGSSGGSGGLGGVLGGGGGESDVDRAKHRREHDREINQKWREAMARYATTKHSSLAIDATDPSLPTGRSLREGDPYLFWYGGLAFNLLAPPLIATGAAAYTFAGQWVGAHFPKTLAFALGAGSAMVGGPQAPAMRAVCRGPGCICFAPGTPVLMADGSTKAIEEVKVGDLVLSDDPEDGAPARAQRVTDVHVTATYRLFRITIAGDNSGELVATGRHPFWTQRGWAAAEELTTDDSLQDAIGRAVHIASIVGESNDTTTYNLSVAETHTFFVVAGGTPVLVHNVDPRDILFTQSNFAPTFAEGPWAGRTLEEAVLEAQRLGRLPDGLTLKAIRLADGTWAALNNRTLAVARMANLSQIHPVDAGAKGFNKMLQLLRNSNLSAPVQDAVMRCK